MKRFALACLLVALGGCIYLPKTTTYYDPQCGSQERRMTLEAQQVAAFVGCANEGCASLLVLAGAVTAASAVISGSVVVVGKTVYWLERQAHCSGRQPAPPEATLP
jgi:hypothetical protein